MCGHFGLRNATVCICGYIQKNGLYWIFMSSSSDLQDITEFSTSRVRTFWPAELCWMRMSKPYWVANHRWSALKTRRVKKIQIWYSVRLTFFKSNLLEELWALNLFRDSVFQKISKSQFVLHASKEEMSFHLNKRCTSGQDLEILAESHYKL